MSKTTTLAPDRQAAPATVAIRPSDRLADALPRHAPGVIPVRPRQDVIVVETDAVTTRVAIPIDVPDDELDALEYSSELL